MHWISLGVIGAIIFGVLWNYVIGFKIVKIDESKMLMLRWRAQGILDQLDSFLCLAVMQEYEIHKTDHLSRSYGQFHYLIVNKKETERTENFITFHYGKFKRIYRVEGIIDYCGKNEKRFSASYYRINSKPIKKMIEILC
jgi:hypothetical protein